MICGSVGIDSATCWLAGAVRIFQKDVKELIRDRRGLRGEGTPFWRDPGGAQ